jgi:hypothetical protein
MWWPPDLDNRSRPETRRTACVYMTFISDLAILYNLILNTD